MLRLQIDSVDFAPFSVWCHHQPDPFPGGHSYRVTVELDEFMEELLPNKESGVTLRRGNGERDYLTCLDVAFQSENEAGRPFDFVLNTVTSFSRDGSNAIFSGKCSPHTHSVRCAGCEGREPLHRILKRRTRCLKGFVVPYRCRACRLENYLKLEPGRVWQGEISSTGNEFVPTGEIHQTGLRVIESGDEALVSLGKLKWKLSPCPFWKLW